MGEYDIGAESSRIQHRGGGYDRVQAHGIIFGCWWVLKPNHPRGAMGFSRRNRGSYQRRAYDEPLRGP